MQLEQRSIRNILLDTIYAYFEPVPGFFKSPTKHAYRVKFRYDGGMTWLEDEKMFTAWHDRQARRMAREIAGSDNFTLEMVRKVK